VGGGVKAVEKRRFEIPKNPGMDFASLVSGRKQ
jgi:hypothetical protein